MAAKIEIGVDVDSAAFAAFYSKYRDYQAALEKTPEAWKKVAKASADARKEAEGAAKAGEEQAAALTSAASSATTLRRMSEATAHAWNNMQRSTLNVAGNIANATASLLKWTGVVGLISGLTGGVGLFGMDRLADSVSSNRSAALGLSTNYGKRQSFLANYERYGDPAGVLARVNAVQHSADKQALLALGLTPAEIQGDTADVAAKAALALQRLVKRTNPAVLEDTLRSRHITDIWDVNQAQVYGNTSNTEAEDVYKSYKSSAGKLDLNKDQQRNWQEFSTQMGRSSKLIENVFAKNLGNLTPGLKKLSEAFMHLIDVVMKHEGPLEDGLKWLNANLEKLAKDIDTPEFQLKVEHFIKQVGDLAKGVASFVLGVVDFGTKLGIISSADAHEYAGNVGGGADNGATGGASGLGRVMDVGIRGAARGAAGGAVDAAVRDIKAGNASSAETKAVIDAAAKRHGVDPRILYGIIAGESLHTNRWDHNPRGEDSWSPFQMNRNGPGSQGYEFEKKTRKSLKDPKNLPDIADYVAGYIAAGKSLAPWRGYHGKRNWDPSWGNMGYSRNETPSYTPNTKTTVKVNPAPGASLPMLLGGWAAQQ